MSVCHMMLSFCQRGIIKVSTLTYFGNKMSVCHMLPSFCQHGIRWVSILTFSAGKTLVFQVVFNEMTYSRIGLTFTKKLRSSQLFWTLGQCMLAEFGILFLKICQDIFKIGFKVIRVLSWMTRSIGNNTNLKNTFCKFD